MAASCIPKWLKPLYVCAAGTMLGSMVSVPIQAIHYPDEPVAFGAWVGAFLMAPFAMTFGIFPTIGVYGPIHGTVAVVGMIMAVAVFVFFLRAKEPDGRLFGWMFVGCALWAHNNYLSWCVMMSV